MTKNEIMFKAGGNSWTEDAIMDDLRSSYEFVIPLHDNRYYVNCRLPQDTQQNPVDLKIKEAYKLISVDAEHGLARLRHVSGRDLVRALERKLSVLDQICQFSDVATFSHESIDNHFLPPKRRSKPSE